MINQVLKKTLLWSVIGLTIALNFFLINNIFKVNNVDEVSDVSAVSQENTKTIPVKKQEIHVVYSTWDECIKAGNSVKAQDVLDAKELENVYLDREYEFVDAVRIGKAGGFLVTYKVIKDN